MEMQLNPLEASLVEAFRRLPADAAAELSALAERLAGLTPNRRIDWPDSWSDDDMADFRTVSLRRLEVDETGDWDRSQVALSRNAHRPGGDEVSSGSDDCERYVPG